MKYIGSIWSINSVVHRIQFLESVFLYCKYKKKQIYSMYRIQAKTINRPYDAYIILYL